MTRIVAGVAGGRRLQVPPGQSTRPTSDRVREALFSSVEAYLGGLAGARVLDLFAGSGALGLEALSRGAALITLVESDARAVRTIRANIAGVGLPGATVVHDSVERVVADGLSADPTVVPRHRDGTAANEPAQSRSGARPTAADLRRQGAAGGAPYDLVLVDPPYAMDSDTLSGMLAPLPHGWLAADALVVVERDRRSAPFEWPDGLTGLRERAYGETVLWYGRSAGMM
ncbi:RsmD family RNA methyltransferase [Phytoactinopolyspora halotolerans]|uniref:RsmD family RNA methyltransferase n=1 Tax=Phytoactinopolyspora halotolerans TaxID=1981512 RepID=A0A6L9SEW7_9ACTN|nr:RsmD family RNA methyltransferase [Phytoactinopolyspora halotolerans]NEE03633.1 RsmD family RNA methyltransferase [Phytoactinopolyspora halotolerans]